MKEKKKGNRKMYVTLGIILAVILLIAIGIIYVMTGRPVTNLPEQPVRGEEGTRSLVVYFSRSDVTLHKDEVDATSSASLNITENGMAGTTELVARRIQEKTGADLYAIQTETYYRSSYMGTAMRALIEKTFHMRPALAAAPENLDDYDVIYVGYPIWWYTAPMAVGTFLEQYDLTGKTIIPFCTSGGNNVEISMDFINEASKGATVLEGITANYASDDALDQWLERTGATE